jgi:hypothetical protein
LVISQIYSADLYFEENYPTSRPTSPSSASLLGLVALTESVNYHVVSPANSLERYARSSRVKFEFTKAHVPPAKLHELQLC